MERNTNRVTCFFLVDDLQEEEDKDELDHNVSVIPLRLIWVYILLSFN